MIENLTYLGVIVLTILLGTLSYFTYLIINAIVHKIYLGVKSIYAYFRNIKLAVDKILESYPAVIKGDVKLGEHSLVTYCGVEGSKVGISGKDLIAYNCIIRDCGKGILQKK